MDYAEWYEIHWKDEDGETGVDKFDTEDLAQKHMRWMSQKYSPVKHAILFRQSSVRLESVAKA